MIILHVIIALTSLGLAIFVAIRPGARRLIANYVFIFATIATGVLLMIEFPGKLLSSCVAGLVYLTIASALTIIGRERLKAHSSVS